MSFIDAIKPDAILMYNQYSVLPSLTLAQAYLESGAGKSALAVEGNNLFGVKWSVGYDKISFPTREYLNNQWVTVNADFRKYARKRDSIIDHARLLQNKRYEKVLTAKSYHEATEEVWKAGYATDPDYPAKLNQLIVDNGWYMLDEDIMRWENRVGAQAIFQLTQDGKISDPETWLSRDLKENTPLWLMFEMVNRTK